MARRIGIHVAVLSSYLLIALVHLRPLAFNLTRTIPRGERMDVLLHGWIINWTSRQLLRAPWDLFEANLFFPHPATLAYTDHMVPEALPVVPIRALTANPVITYNVAYLLTFVLAGWGTFLLVRRLTGNAWAAWIAGAFCCYFPAKRWSLAHINTISVHGVPFAMLALHRMLEKPTVRRSLVAGVAIALASLMSPYYTVYLPLLLLLGVPAIWWAERWPLDRRRLIGLGTGAVAAAALALPVLLHYLRTWTGGEGPARSYDLQIAGAANVSELFMLDSYVWSRTLPDNLDPLTTPFFPGAVVTLLVTAALVGALRARRPDDSGAALGPAASSRLVAAYAAIAGTAMLMALGPRLKLFSYEGPTLPYHLVYYLVPGASSLRAPYRAGILGQAFVAVIIGLGAAWLLPRIEASSFGARLRRVAGARESASIAPAALAILLVALMTVEILGAPLPLEDLPQPATEVYEWLADQPGDFGIFEWPVSQIMDRAARGQWLSTLHWKRRIMGHNGRVPADVRELHSLSRELEPGFLTTLRDRFPVRYVIVHLHAFEPDYRRMLEQDVLPGLDEWWKLERSFGDDLVYRVRNGGEARNLERRFAGWMARGTLVVRLAAPVPGNGAWRFAAELAGEVIERSELEGGADEVRVSIPAGTASPDPVWLRLAIEGPAGQTLVVERIFFETPEGFVYP